MFRSKEPNNQAISLPSASLVTAEAGDWLRPKSCRRFQPAAGWGAAISVSKVLLKQGELIDGTRVVFKMNHENGGYDCPGCAWPDDRKGLTLDICENGIKHATWEMTHGRVNRDFFAAHTVKEFMGWTDYALEAVGRLTEPMRYDAVSNKYVSVSWEEAFELAGRHFRALDNPNQAAFYTSGRLSNEATFLYQLFARELGTNNLPDCSNMCHEASGRALTAARSVSRPWPSPSKKPAVFS